MRQPTKERPVCRNPGVRYKQNSIDCFTARSANVDLGVSSLSQSAAQSDARHGLHSISGKLSRITPAIELMNIAFRSQLDAWSGAMA